MAPADTPHPVHSQAWTRSSDPSRPRPAGRGTHCSTTPSAPASGASRMARTTPVVRRRRSAQGVAGVVLTCLEPADDEDVRTARARRCAAPAAGELVLHVRAVAVAPEARRAGIARRLLARAESEAARQGAAAAYLFAWLPAGQPEPAAVPLYLATGYVARTGPRGLLRGGQRRERSRLPVLRPAAVPLRGAAVRQGPLRAARLTGRRPRGLLSAPSRPATRCGASSPSPGRRATRSCRSAGRAGRS